MHIEIMRQMASRQMRGSEPWTTPFPSNTHWEMLLTITTTQSTCCMTSRGEHLPGMGPQACWPAAKTEPLPWRRDCTVSSQGPKRPSGHTEPY